MFSHKWNISQRDKKKIIDCESKPPLRQSKHYQEQSERGTGGERERGGGEWSRLEQQM